MNRFPSDSGWISLLRVCICLAHFPLSHSGWGRRCESLRRFANCTPSIACPVSMSLRKRFLPIWWWISVFPFSPWGSVFAFVAAFPVWEHLKAIKVAPGGWRQRVSLSVLHSRMHSQMHICIPWLRRSYPLPTHQMVDGERVCVRLFFLRFRSRSSEKRVDDNQNREFITVAYMGYSWWRRKNYTPVFGFATGSRLDRLSRGEVPICLHLTPATRRKEEGTHKFGH